MWTSTPFFIQEQMVDEIYTKNQLLYCINLTVIFFIIPIKV